MRDDSPETPRPESHRASLRGRGWEILRGQAALPETPPETPPEADEAVTEPALTFEPEPAPEVEPGSVAEAAPDVGEFDLLDAVFEDEFDFAPEASLALEAESGSPPSPSRPEFGDLDILEAAFEDVLPPQPQMAHAAGTGPLSDEPPDDPLDWLLEPHLDAPLVEAEAALETEDGLPDWTFEAALEEQPEVSGMVVEPDTPPDLPTRDDFAPPEVEPAGAEAVELFASPELSKLQPSPAPLPEEGEALPLAGDAQAAAQLAPVYAPPPEVEALTPAAEELDDAAIAALAGPEAAVPPAVAPPAPEPAGEVERVEAPPLALAAVPQAMEYAPPPEVEALTPAAEELDEAAIAALAGSEAAAPPAVAPPPAPEAAAAVENVEAPPLAQAAAPEVAAYAPPPEVEALTPAAEELDEAAIAALAGSEAAAPPAVAPQPALEAAAAVENVEAPPLAQAAAPDVVAYAPPPEVETLTPAMPEELGHVPEGIAALAEMGQDIDALSAELDALLAETDTLAEDDALPALDDWLPLEDDFFLPDVETAPLDRSRLREADQPETTGQADEADQVPVVIAPPPVAPLQEAVPGLRVLAAPPEAPLGGVGIAIPQDVRIDAARLSPPTARPRTGELAARAREADDLVHKLVTDERLETLWAELEATQDAVTAQAGDPPALAERLQQELLQASSLLLQDRAHYDDARVMVNRVRAALAHQEKATAAIARYRPQITLFLVIMLALWLLLLALEPVFRQFIQNINLAALAFVYHPALFGMLGGIVAAYLALHKHTIRQRDFDAAYVSWYLMAPLAGLITGLLTTLLAAAAIVSTLRQPSSLNDLPFLLWLVAFVAGFYHNTLLGLLGRLSFWRRGSEGGDGPPNGGG